MGHCCSRVELVTTVVVDHRSTNPTDGQAHCFRNVLQRDRECSCAASASDEKVEQIALGLLTNRQVRALAHSAPALQLDDLARVFDSTGLALASEHQASPFESTFLVVEDLFQSNVLPHCSSGHLHHSISTES